MNPLILIAVPLGLVILGMILNSLDLLGSINRQARRSKIRLRN